MTKSNFSQSKTEIPCEIPVGKKIGFLLKFWLQKFAKKVHLTTPKKVNINTAMWVTGAIKCSVSIRWDGFLSYVHRHYKAH